jgi:transposase
VAQVALAHGLNTNLVHKWRRQRDAARTGSDRSAAPAFVPVTMTAAKVHCASDIRIELRRGATLMTITWPLEASSQCASWMRELLR